MDYLELQYLKAANELRDAHAMNGFNEDEVGKRIGLDPDQPDLLDKLVRMTFDLLERGYIESQSKGLGSGYRALRITTKGTDEAKKASDPIVQRKEERARLLRTIYLLSDGNPAQLVRWRDIASELGLDAGNREHLKQVIAVAEYMQHSGLVVIIGDRGTAYMITAEGVNEVERNGQQEATSTTTTTTNFNFNAPVHGSVIGTNNTAELTNNFDFRRIEVEIEEKGGADKEELREALAEIRGLLESGQSLDRGALSKFSEVMERHSWFTGSVAQGLIGFATQIMAG